MLRMESRTGIIDLQKINLKFNLGEERVSVHYQILPCGHYGDIGVAPRDRFARRRPAIAVATSGKKW